MSREPLQSDSIARIAYLGTINPSVKFAAMAFSMIVPALALDPYTPLAFLLVATASAVALGGVRLGRLLRLFVPFLFPVLGFVWLNAFFFEAPGSAALFRVGPFTATEAGLLAGISIAVRALCYTSFSLLFALTTDPTEFVLSLMQQCRLSPRAGYAILAAYRFLPILKDELELIRAAHRIRGLGAEPTPAHRLRTFRRYAIPLLASTIRRADRLAIAMEARAFGNRIEGRRGFYRCIPLHRRDGAFLGVMVAINLLLLLLATRLGSIRLWGGGPTF